MLHPKSPPSNYDIREAEAQYNQRRRDHLFEIKKHLADGVIIDILKKKFTTDLPCFQGKSGNYDALDAMKRDSHREVILWLESELIIAHNEHP